MLLLLLEMLNVDRDVLCRPLVLLFLSNTVLYPSLLLLSLLILFCPLNEFATG
jgi:hypothetical protein